MVCLVGHSWLVYSVILIITVNFLSYSVVNSVSLFHHMRYHNFAYAIDAEHYTIIIPKGSANPEVDITKLGPRQWYLPGELAINLNDRVTWVNDDTEAHTVTSGVGISWKAW
jgi:hypothetical protein